jgi:hypothetical protein
MTQAATLNTGPHHEPASSTTIRFRLPGELAIALDGEPIAPSPHHTQGSLAALRLYPRLQRRERPAGMRSPHRRPFGRLSSGERSGYA